MKTIQPRVSIGLPVYNGERFLREAIDSILGQTFTDFELIISDNASSDGTQEICQEYAAKDRRIRYYRNEQNLGVSWNHNRVFELSTGEYFKWAGHDDLCKPEYLKRCVEVLDLKPFVVLCYSQSKKINEDRTSLRNYDVKLNTMSPKPHERFGSLLKDRHLCSELYGVIRRTTLETTSLFRNYYGSDQNLITELALLGQFYEIPECLFLRGEHSKKAARLWPKEQERLIHYDYYPPTKTAHFPFLKRNLGYLSSVARVSLGWNERLLCYAQLVKWWQKTWRVQVREGKVALQSALKSFQPLK